MDPELKKMVKETLDMTRENNAMLIKLRHAQKIANMYRVFYWLVIIFISFGSYYYVKPYLGTIFNYYGSMTGGAENISKSIPDLKHIQDLLNQMKK